jgi:NitT/TauT family transport system permease protein
MPSSRGSTKSSSVPGSGPRSVVQRKLSVFVAQICLLVLFIAGWQFLPTLRPLQRVSHLFDRFFVGSPTDVAVTIGRMIVGAKGTVTIWPYLWPTFGAAIAGTIIGMVTGGLAGLILSNSEFLSEVVRPFIVAANATPRIALIPIVVLLVGPEFSASIIISVLVVFFVAFFNAYEGGVTIPTHVVHNAKLLGADGWDIMRHIRFPYVAAWTMAALPLGVTFAVISVVTAEIFTGYPGMGRLLVDASVSAQSSMTFALTLLLATLGLTIVIIAEHVKKRILHWWGKG